MSTYSITMSSVTVSSFHVLFPFFPLFTARKIPILNMLLAAYMSQHNFALAQDLVYFLNHSAMNNDCFLGPHHAGSAFPHHHEVPLNFKLLQKPVSIHTATTLRMLLITVTTSIAQANDLLMTFPSSLTFVSQEVKTLIRA